ncbi:MAG: hypothetical protein QG671_3350 [Actinomycetota bacterium]|nr:hypothetical protein [Actinomycetota bacterium]
MRLTPPTDPAHLTCCSPTPLHVALAAGLSAPSGLEVPAGIDRRPVNRRADRVVFGRVATGVPGAAEADGIAISGGMITGVGSASDLDSLVGPGTEIITVADGVISPGLIEPHMHIWTTMMVDPWPDLSPMANPAFDDVVATLKKAAQQTAEGDWVKGKLFDPSLYPGEPNLTRDILDQVSPDKPVFVLNASMHFAYINSKAMALAGLADDTPDPPGGFFGRADGKLNGVLGESGAISKMLAVVPQPSQQEAAGTIIRILQGAAAAGVTSVREAATGAVIGTGEVGLLHQLNAAHPLPVRVSTAQWGLLGNDAWKEAGVTPFAGDDMVRAVAWKVVTDGSNQGRSGYFEQPYLNEDTGGHANMTPEKLVELMTEGLDAGWQLMVHANGDAAVEFALEGYEAALAGRETADLRHRMEHVSFAFDQNFARMAKAGVSPSFLMNHVYFWGRVFRDNILGPERADRLDRVATALKHGLRPSLHSDFNVTKMQPLLSAQTAVLRVMRDNGEVLNAAECVSAEEALTAITTNAAWQIHADDRGTLEVGKRADYTILSDNPWTAAPDSWHAITVRETRVGGEVTFSS